MKNMVFVMEKMEFLILIPRVENTICAKTNTI